MPASAAPVPQPPAVPTWLPVDEMLGCVLEVSLTGLVFYLPVYDPADASKVVDFRFAHLNPAAQRMLRLPPAPANSFLQQFPDTLTNGSFAYHRDTFLSGELRNFEQYYQSGGYDNFFRVAGRRAGEGLLVSFTDTSDRPRSAVEEALRASQVREQAAYAASIAQHEQLRNVLQQAPVAIALLEGRNYHITLANPPVCEIWARTEAQLLGRPLLEAMPELQGQGVDTLLDGVLDSGEPYTGTELPFQLVRHGCLDTIYFNFVYQPQRDAQGTVTGVLVVAHNVTEQVLSRQLIEQQERATSELNEELAVANEEIRANNDELMRAHQDLRNLNEELEARVAERTHELTEALQEAQRHREQIRTQERYLQQILGQVPASLATLSGPEHRFTFFNEHYQQLAGHRVQLGRTVAETLPEVVGQGFIELLNNVYATGEPFIGIEMAAQLYNPATGRNEQRYIDFIYQPLVDRHGRANDILAFIVDTTDKVLSRQRVEESQRQLRLLTDALPVLIAYIDHEQKYQFVNQAYQAWFGHEPAAMQGRTVRELVGQEAYAEVKGYVEQALTGQRIDFEARMQYRKDFVRHIHTSYVPDIQDGQVAGFFSLVVDVSDQVEARQQVQSLNEDLAAINEELLASNEELGDKNQQLTRVNVDLDNFIYTASHDLKAPISNIEGLLYLLREELPANVMTDETVGIILTRMLDSV
ncbi:MAG: sensor histidine kinase, partial [Hymenobacter sp.]|nr:sensor histidine kinase [Hymenobacter sp.]